MNPPLRREVRGAGDRARRWALQAGLESEPMERGPHGSSPRRGVRDEPGHRQRRHKTHGYASQSLAVTLA